MLPDGITGCLEEPELQGNQSMILNLGDRTIAYFNIEILRNMRNLRISELRAETDSKWGPEDYKSALMRELKDEGELHPEGAMPLIKIVKKQTGEVGMDLGSLWTIHGRRQACFFNDYSTSHLMATPSLTTVGGCS